MFLSEYLMDAAVNGREGGRMGNRHPYRAPQGCYPAQGQDQWVVLSVGDDTQWQALCRLMEREELAQDPRFADALARQRHHDALDEILRAWTVNHDKYELMHRLQGAGIPAGPVLTGRDVHFDPHYRSRGFLERVTYPPQRQMGARIFMGRPYKLSQTPLQIRGPAPAFGQDNGPLLKELLGLEEDAYQKLVQDAIIATVPTSGEASPITPPERSVRTGALGGWDPHYRENLDL
jgi:crotonobetainyl-CoA:carnitine CoA-transferase CaiB-like acyl-CoA transferase